MRLRQLVLVTSDLRTTERELCETLDVEVCYRDPGLAHFGLRHGLYAIGDRLLEVVMPARADTTAGRFLERRGGNGGYMVIVQVDDLDAEQQRLAETDIRIVHEAEAPGVRGIHLHPRDVGGAILSIDQADPPESWAWAGSDWQYHRTDTVVTDMVAAEMAAKNPAAMAARWGEALGLSPDDHNTIHLDDSQLRFVPVADDRGEALLAIDLVAADPSRAGQTNDIGGVVFRFV